MRNYVVFNSLFYRCALNEDYRKIYYINKVKPGLTLYTILDNIHLSEEGLAYALTGLPSTSNPASSPIATSSTNALAGSSSSSGITPPLIIKSESKAPQPVTDKPNKATDTSRSDDIPDSVYERQETSLECVAKQLCQNEVVVVTTIYCSYTGTKTLPEDLMRSDKSDVSKESSSAEDRASKRRRLDSSSEQPSGPGYSQSEIEKVLERVDGTPYCSEMTAFIHNLVANTDNGPDIVETLCKMLGKRAPSALFISLLFVRSLTKYLAVQLTNIGPRECLEDLPEYRLTVETQKLLTSFGMILISYLSFCELQLSIVIDLHLTI